MISIVMPTYDRAATLPRAIDSVLAQTLDDWELIVVDDGSSDETAMVLARYRDPRIRVYRHGYNRGVAAAKNTGFDHIAGEWFTVLDSDDEIVPDALATLLDTARSTGAAAITCNCVSAGTGQLTGHGWDADGWKGEADMTRISGEHWGMQKAALLGTKRFDERLPGMEGILWIKITHAAGRRYYLHKGLRIYHPEGGDRVSAVVRSRRERIAIDRAIGDDTAYLHILRATNPDKYRRVVRRAWRARVLSVIVRDRVSRAPRRDAAA
jgi:glycosyltransferase involved in cell wall biosynthesis